LLTNFALTRKSKLGVDKEGEGANFSLFCCCIEEDGAEFSLICCGKEGEEKEEAGAKTSLPTWA
jgi:hypothetical protein